MVYVPVFAGAGGCLALFFNFLEVFYFKAVQKLLDLFLGMKGHGGVAGPAIPLAKELSGKAPARPNGRNDLVPEFVKIPRRAER